MALNATNATLYEELMDSYFAETGIGYTFGRVPMGSCDFSPYAPSWSYDDVADDFNLDHFSLRNDEERRLPILRDALSRTRAAGRDLKILGSPWSAPAWMKKNGDMICGLKALFTGCVLKDDPRYHKAFASYYARWVKAYEAALGTAVWGLTVMNEPQENILTYEGQVFTAETERDFIKNFLGPTLAAEAPGTKLLILDHNKDMLEEWAGIILGDPDAAKHVWGSGVHWYSGDHFDALNATHSKFPEFSILATEATSALDSKHDTQGGTWSKGEHYAHDMIGDFSNWVTGFVDWNLALDLHGGPLHVNVEVSDLFGSDSAVILDTKNGHIYYQAIFYYIGHFSKFVQQGSTRIWSSLSRLSSAGQADLPSVAPEAVAFQNGDEIVLVLMNRMDNGTSVAIRDSGEETVLDMLPHSIHTLVYPAREPLFV